MGLSWNWPGRRPPRRRRSAAPRRKPAPLLVRRLEARRVLDASTGALMLAPLDQPVPPTVNEGTMVTASAPAASGTGTLIYEWTLTQGATELDSGFGTTFTFLAPDDGMYEVNLVLTDSAQTVDQTTVTVDVLNVDPVIDTISITTPINEDDSATLSGTYHDMGPLDTHELDIDWDGDGTYDQTVSVSDGSFMVDHPYLDDNPTNTPSDTFNVNVRLRDDDTGQDTDSVSLTVDNLDPSIDTLSITTPIDEDGTATLSGTYSDTGTLDTHELEIDWDGDGTYDQTVNVSGGSFMVDHTYLDDDPTNTPSDTFNVNVRLRDDDTGEDTDSVSLTVDNLDPSIDTLSITTPIDENGTATLSGTYSDTGTLDTHELDIDWDGDGTYDQTVSVSGGSFMVDHPYLDDNPTNTPSDTFNVNVRLRDDDTGEDTDSVSLTVDNLDPSIDTLSITTPIDENGTATLSGTYSDTGTLDTHQLDIDWDGDGTYDQMVNVSGGSFMVDHTYLDDDPTNTPSDTFNVNVRLRDDDTGQDTDSVSLTVDNLDPSIDTLSITTPIDENGTATLSGTYSDTGTLDTHQLDIDWDGDGTYDQTVNVSGGSFMVDHPYLDDDPSGTPSDTFNVNVRLRDDDTGQDTDSVSLTVDNVAPTVVLEAVDMIDENGTATLTGSYSDTGLLDSHTLTVDWDDANDATDSVFHIDPINTLAVNDTYNSMTDDAVLVITGISGSTVSFSVQHQYLDDGASSDPFPSNNTASDTSTIVVSDEDDDTGTNNDDTTVLVKNVAPTVTLDAVDMIDENGTATLDGSYTDTGLHDVHTLTVDWDDPNNATNSVFTIDPISGLSIGDMVSSSTDGAVLVITDISGSTVGFQVQHQYLDDGTSPGNDTVSDTSTIVVTIADDDTQSNNDDTTVLVKNVIPEFDTVVANQDVNEGDLVDLTGMGGASFLGTFSDVGTLDFHTAFVLWGDGHSEMVTVDDNGGTGTLGTSHTYADDGVYTVTIRLADDDMSADFLNGEAGVDYIEQTFTVIVNNVVPTFTDGTITSNDPENPGSSSSGVTINENESVSFSVDFSDPGFDNPLNTDPTMGPEMGDQFNESFSYFIDWGDGRQQVANSADFDTDENGMPMVPSTGSFSNSHTYADDGVYTVTIRLADDNMSADFADGDAGIDFVERTFTVTVDNVDPALTLTPSSPTSINEGGSVSFGATFSDRGFDNLANTDPTMGPAVGDPLRESFTFDVDWGDGRDEINGMSVADMNGGPTVPSSGSFTGSHTYADNGTYTVRVTIHDDNGGSHFQTFIVTVANVDPTLTGTTNLEVNEGQAFTLKDLGVGLEDPGFDNALNDNMPPNGGEVAETFTAFTIDFGDGRGTSVPVSIDNMADRTSGEPGVTTKALFTHDAFTYADDGVYTVTVTLQDDDGAAVMRTFTITVNNVAPTLNLAVGNQSVLESEDLILPTIATFTDPGFDNGSNPNAAVQPLIADPLTESFAYFIDWGDGRDQIGTMSVADMNGDVGVPSGGSFGASHNYADDGVYTVTVRIADDNMSAFGSPELFQDAAGEENGHYVEQTFTVTVGNINPSFVPTGDGAAFSGTPVTAEGVTQITLSFNDFGYDNPSNPLAGPGNPLAESFTYIVDWGDGTVDTIQVTNSGAAQVINGQTTMLASLRESGDATTLTTGGSVIQHTYLGPPDPLHPTADIIITVTLVDDNGGTDMGTIAITNPGIQNQMVAIDTTINVPRLVIPEIQMAEAAPLGQINSTQTLQRQDVRTASSELTAASERYWELRVVYFDGTEGEGYRLKDEALNDLRKLFSTLPDDQYAIYVVRTENNSRRLVMVVTVRRGRLIDVSDDSEGTRDRPPTAEQPDDEIKAMPLEENPLLDSSPAGIGFHDALPPAEPPQATPAPAEAPLPQSAAGEAEEATPEAVDSQAYYHPGRSWRWAALLAGLAVATAAGGWSQQVDQAFEKADDRSWQRLRRAGRFGRSKFGRNGGSGRSIAKPQPVGSAAGSLLQSANSDKYNGNSGR